MSRTCTDIAGTTPKAVVQASAPFRVLHVLGCLDRGGAETWLMDVARRVSRDELAIDVCLTQEKHGAYEEEFKRLGGRVFRCPLGRNPLRFARALGMLLEGNGYHAVHSHLYFFSGVVLRTAARARVRQRIAHNHPVEDLKAGRLRRRMYARLMMHWMRQYGTDFVGPTRASLEAMWGPLWESDPHKRVLYNGVDVARFSRPVDRAAVRAELGFPADARIVLNVGRFVPHKNQEFLVPVALEIALRRGDVCFLMIGDGPLWAQVQEQVGRAGLSDRFRFVRGEPDIDRYWLAADVFAFPSINEGFGIVVAEAAAAGLPVVAHDIPGVREAATACRAVSLLPLGSSTGQWCDAVLNSIETSSVSPFKSPDKSFPYSIEASVQALKDLYGLTQPSRNS